MPDITATLLPIEPPLVLPLIQLNSCAVFAAIKTAKKEEDNGVPNLISIHTIISPLVRVSIANQDNHNPNSSVITNVCTENKHSRKVSNTGQNRPFWTG